MLLFHTVLAWQMNPVLNELFADLYELILGRLSRFDLTVLFHDCLTLPGFHVFGLVLVVCHLFESCFWSWWTIHNHPIPLRFAELIGWLPDDLPPDFDSVTIPLCLPASGGGLNLWPNGVDDDKPIYYPYSVGHAVHFAGELRHQIAPYRPALMVSQPEYRITLQCHFFRMQGSASLFF